MTPPPTRQQIPSASSPLRRRVLALIPPIVALALYAPTLGFQFVWDDTYFVVRNESIRSLANVPRFFHDPATSSSFADLKGLYRPLRNVTYAIDHAVWGLRPAGFHFANILLHAFNSWLVWFLLWSILTRARGHDEEEGDNPANDGQASIGCVPANRVPANRVPAPADFAALAGALLWAVHPLATEAVCWVKSRDDLLVTAFCLAGAIQAARTDWTTRLKTRRLALFALLHAGALLSKETGVMFPAFVLLSAWLTSLHVTPRRIVRILPVLAVGGALDVLYLALRHTVVGEFGQLERPLAEGAALFWTQVRATATGLGLAVWPLPLLADYQAFRISSSAGAAEWMSLGVLTALVAAALLSLRKRPALSFAILWWSAAILPVSNLIPTMQFLAERFLYLALAGMAVGFGILVDRALQRRFRARWALALTAAIIILLAIRTTLRVPVWSNGLTLYEATLRRSPASTRVRSNLGKELFRLERYAEAADTFAALPPDHPVRMDYLDDARYLAGHAKELEDAFAGVDADPGALEPRLRLADFAIRAHLPETAAAQIKEALRIDSAAWRVHAEHAVLRMRTGRAQEAFQIFEEAQSLARETAGDDSTTSAALREFRRRLERGPWHDAPTP